jgi:hypothetical protein
MAVGDSRHEEWSATLAARRELGAEYDQAFVENLVERLSDEIETRVDVRLAEVTRSSPVAQQRRRGSAFVALASITLGIPLTAIAGAFGHLPGLAVAWGGIVLVNAAHSRRSHGPQ